MLLSTASGRGMGIQPHRSKINYRVRVHDERWPNLIDITKAKHGITADDGSGIHGLEYIALSDAACEHLPTPYSSRPYRSNFHLPSCTPIIPSTDGKRYFITFIDNFSRYCWVFFILRKDAKTIRDIYEMWRADAENKAGACPTSRRLLPNRFCNTQLKPSKPHVWQFLLGIGLMLGARLVT